MAYKICYVKRTQPACGQLTSGVIHESLTSRKTTRYTLVPTRSDSFRVRRGDYGVLNPG